TITATAMEQERGAVIGSAIDTETIPRFLSGSGKLRGGHGPQGIRADDEASALGGPARQVERAELRHVARGGIHSPRGEHGHLQRGHLLPLDVAPGTVSVPERFRLIIRARRHPQGLEQLLAHQPWEWLPCAELEGMADQVISQVGIAEALPHPALQPGVGDTPDVLVERAVPVAVVVTDRGLVTKARPVAEQVT